MPHIMRNGSFFFWQNVFCILIFALCQQVLTEMPTNKLQHETDRHFKLIGIATTLKGYRLCYELNSLLQLTFSRQPDTEIELKERSTKATFAVFSAIAANSQNEFILFGNKMGQELLLNEAGSLDFLLKITGSYKETKALVKMIRQMNEVITAVEITTKTIKQADRLLYELPIEVADRKPRKKRL